jgi:hypothetical protein
MEKDSWKSFIDENREEFDNEMPSAQVWGNVERGLGPKMIRLSTVLRIAAVLVVMLGAGIWWMLRPTPEQPLAKKDNTSETGFVLASVAPEYQEVESYYVNKIDDAMDELETLQPDKELFAAIAELDAEFKQLQKEMGDAVNKEEIIQAMIENYRLKLELLETMVQSLKGEPEAEESAGEESDEYKTI